MIEKAYDKAGGVKTECARILGVKTSALYYKLEKYGIGVIQPRAGEGGEGGDTGGEDVLADGPLGAGEPKPGR